MSGAINNLTRTNSDIGLNGDPDMQLSTPARIVNLSVVTFFSRLSEKINTKPLSDNTSAEKHTRSVFDNTFFACLEALCRSICNKFHHSSDSMQNIVAIKNEFNQMISNFEDQLAINYKTFPGSLEEAKSNLEECQKMIEERWKNGIDADKRSILARFTDIKEGTTLPKQHPLTKFFDDAKKALKELQEKYECIKNASEILKALKQHYRHASTPQNRYNMLYDIGRKKGEKPIASVDLQKKCQAALIEIHKTFSGFSPSELLYEKAGDLFQDLSGGKCMEHFIYKEEEKKFYKVTAVNGYGAEYVGCDNM